MYDQNVIPKDLMKMRIRIYMNKKRIPQDLLYGKLFTQEK